MNADRLDAMRQYWERPAGSALGGIEWVPQLTGAAAVMDCSDLIEACAKVGVTGLPVPGWTLDVGCGTGRFAKFCERWTGVDVSQQCVDYCRLEGLHADRIDGPTDLPAGPFFYAVCFSLFTHMGREERVEYLRALATRCRRLIADIIPGPDSDGIALATALPTEFEADLLATGWDMHRAYERLSPDGVVHRYYSAKLKA